MGFNSAFEGLKRRNVRNFLHFLLLFVQNGHWIYGLGHGIFTKHILLSSSPRDVNGQTRIISFSNSVRTRSQTHLKFIAVPGGGRFVTLVSRKVSSRGIDLKLPIPVGLPEVRERSLEQVHQTYRIFLNFPPLNWSPKRWSSNVSSLNRLLQSITILLTFNHLKTKRRLLYLKTQSVPRCKHFSSRL
jgi:hypothetical protein